MTEEEKEIKLKEINKEIKKLEKQLDEVVGTITSVYTRIVGYYRNVSNWNPGKEQEYKERVPFKIDEQQTKEMTE